MSRMRTLYCIHEVTKKGDKTIREYTFGYTTSKESIYDKFERRIDMYNNAGGTFYCERVNDSDEMAVAYQVNGKDYITENTIRIIIWISSIEYEDY